MSWEILDLRTCTGFWNTTPGHLLLLYRTSCKVQWDQDCATVPPTLAWRTHKGSAARYPGIFPGWGRGVGRQRCCSVEWKFRGDRAGGIWCVMNWINLCTEYSLEKINRPDSRFAPSQWETVLHCNDVSLWLGANLESASIKIYCTVSL